MYQKRNTKVLDIMPQNVETISMITPVNLNPLVNLKVNMAFQNT